jgi:nucleoside-diphosphate-sugar epimerase
MGRRQGLLEGLGGLNMKILVTGSEGYIGSALVPFLINGGHTVTGLDACYFDNRRFIGETVRYNLIRRDVRDVETGDLRGYDAVCHLAALSNDPAGDLTPGVTEDINYHGTVTLAVKAKNAGVRRFIFSSSCSMYGEGNLSEYLTEEAKFNPVTAYAHSKVLAEKDLLHLADNDFSPVYLRNATAFGSSPKLRLDLVVNNLVGLAHATNAIAMTSDGTPWRPLVHVRDICMAFKCALEAPRSAIHNQAFNIGRTDTNHQVREIAERIGAVIKGAQITFGTNNSGNPDKRTYRVSFEKALKNLPGFVPAWSLDDGIHEIYDSYKRFGLKKEHLYGDEFVTLNRYKKLLSEGAINPDFRWTQGAA